MSPTLFHYTSNWPAIASKFFLVLSGGIAGCVAELFALPFDTLKVKSQTSPGSEDNCRLSISSKFKQTIKIFGDTYKKEGLYSFYGGKTGLKAAFQRQLVMSSVKFGCYELVKNKYCNLLGFTQDPNFSPHIVKLLSSATTGGLAVLIGQPTDVVKVRIQANMDRYRSISQAYKDIYFHEGVIRGLWRGTFPGILRNMLINMADIGLYDIIKDGVLRNNIMGDNWFCFVICSFWTGIAATIISSPVDVVKTVYSNSTQNEHENLWDCCKYLWKENGIRSFYRGVTFNACRQIIYNIVIFVTLEALRNQMDN